jgi:hypothetical protein
MNCTGSRSNCNVIKGNLGTCLEGTEGTHRSLSVHTWCMAKIWTKLLSNKSLKCYVWANLLSLIRLVPSLKYMCITTLWTDIQLRSNSTWCYTSCSQCVFSQCSSRTSKSLIHLVTSSFTFHTWQSLIYCSVTPHTKYSQILNSYEEQTFIYRKGCICLLH